MTESRRRPGRIRPRPKLDAEPEAAPSPAPRKSFVDQHKAGISAIAGVVAGGLLTLVVTVVQINGEDKRSSVEFTRTQRQQVYAKLIADEYQLRRLEDDFRDMVAAAKPAPELSAQRVKVDDAYLAFKADVGSATMVGSAETAAKATLIDIDHDLTRSAIDKAEEMASNNRLDQPARVRFASDYKYPAEHGSDPKAKMLDFVMYARVDVLNPDLTQLGGG